MVQPSKTGFTLFPMPPTPPATKTRYTPRSTDVPQVPTLVVSDDNKSKKVQLDDDVFQSPRRPISTLVPAPLKLRKNVEVPPAPRSAPLPARAFKKISIPRLETSPSFRAKSRPGPPPSLPLPSPLVRAHSSNDVISEAEQARTRPEVTPYQTPVKRKQAPSLHLSPEKQGSPQRRAKRASWRISEWLDIQGDVDHRKLSVYLGHILNTSFTIEDIEALTKEKGNTDIIVVDDDDDDDDFFEDFLNNPKKKKSEPTPKVIPSVEKPKPEQPKGIPPSPKKVYYLSRCSCPAGTILCQCNSSEEFQRFKRDWQSKHKANDSVSSTVCMLQVPRARFRTTLPQVKEPESPTITSPPGLAYDSEGSENDGVPQTPSRKPVTPPRQRSIRSFSRPFRSDGTISPDLYHEPSTPATPETPELCKSSSFLGSVSTMSTFSFDFELDSDNDSNTSAPSSVSSEAPMTPTTPTVSSITKVDSTTNTKSAIPAKPTKLPTTKLAKPTAATSNTTTTTNTKLPTVKPTTTTKPAAARPCKPQPRPQPKPQPRVIIRNSFHDSELDADLEATTLAEAIVTTTLKAKPIMVNLPRPRSKSPPKPIHRLSTALPAPQPSVKHWAPRNSYRGVVRGLPPNMQMHTRVPRLVVTNP